MALHMTDVVPSEKRSRMMSGIRGKDTKPELIVRKALFAASYRFRLHRKELPGSPDIVFARSQIAIFVHGCFWHMHAQCKYAKLPETHREFWLAKLSGNVERDQRAQDALVSAGWRVLTVWECATRDSAVRATLASKLIDWITGDEPTGTIRSGQT